MTIGEGTALIGLFITVLGFFVRYGIVLPMKNIIQPLEISITGLREEVANTKEFQKDTQAILQNHDIRISLQEQAADMISKRVDIVEDRRGK